MGGSVRVICPLSSSTPAPRASLLLPWYNGSVRPQLDQAGLGQLCWVGKGIEATACCCFVPDPPPRAPSCGSLRPAPHALQIQLFSHPDFLGHHISFEDDQGALPESFAPQSCRVHGGR